MTEMEPQLTAQAINEQEEDTRTNKLTAFVEKYGMPIAGAALAATLGILFMKTDAGQSLSAQVLDLM